MKYVILSLLNLLILGKTVRCQFNPCPEIIEFEPNGTETVAVITVPPPGKGITILNVTIEVFGPSLGKPLLSLSKSVEETAIDAENGLHIQYIYKFPRAEQYPRIIQILLNHREICSAPASTGFGSRTTWPTSRVVYIPSDSTSLSYIPYHLLSPPRRGAQSSESWVHALAGQCGREVKPEVITQLIINGVKIVSGEFPWMVAMYRGGFRREGYICGGSVVSDKYVVTAAHCTNNQQRVYLELGRHNISNPDEVGFIQRVSLSIFNSPEYVAAPEDDIALILIQRIDFTNKIRPICLWPQTKDEKDESILHGQVTGWGITENGNEYSTASIPMKLGVRTATASQCRNAHYLYKNVNTDKSFCAGGEKAGPCVGDSGGGFYVRQDNVWYLRGVVSVSVAESSACNLETYAIYTDISYYLDWLKTYLS